MTGTDDSDFFTVELENGGVASAMNLEMPPFGVGVFYSADESDEAREMLTRFRTQWADLWPQMRSRLEECAGDVDATSTLVKDSATVYITKTEPGKFMSDQSDTYLSISFEDGPDWNFFLKRGAIVHFQPVF